jgi:NAD dependent epimerase/dehydratase
MKTALITGADGFIGSHLTELLVTKGYKVRALSQYNSFNNWGWLEDVSCVHDIEVISGDIRDINICNEICKNVDVVFHLAALIAIPYSYRAPASYIDTNVTGTLNICQACKENNVEMLIHTSTSEVYGSAIYVPINEEHPLQAQSPYSASKIGADAIANSFYTSFDLPVVIARPFNTYGPRQSARAVIPSIISQIASKRETVNLGDLSPTRDFNFVLDTCLGLVALAETENLEGEVINIGSNFEISISDTFDLIKQLMGSNVQVVEKEDRLRPKKSEVNRLLCDNSKLIAKTGFKPSFTIRDGLEKTIEWFTNPRNLAFYKSDRFNL